MFADLKRLSISLPLRKALVLLGLATVIVVLMALFFFDPHNPGTFPPCPTWAFASLYCPGCGTMRGLHLLLHGDVWGALQRNVLMVVAVPWIVVRLASLAANAWGMTSAQVWALRSPALSRSLFWIVLLFGALRNIPVMPLVWLAP